MIYMNMMIKLKTKEVLFSGPEMEFGVVLRKLIDLMRDAGFKTWFDGEVEKFKKKLCSWIHLMVNKTKFSRFFGHLGNTL